jgi:hypothetical protein
MNKPYIIISNSKSKKPQVLGNYKNIKAAEKAFLHFTKKNEQSRELQKKYPGAGIEDLFCDLKIILKS